MPFSSLGLPKYLYRALARQNFDKPYPIQEAAIPAIISNKDILGIAQTGSGKTMSYVLPLLANLEGEEVVSERHINVLVLVPSRELAVQVASVFKQFIPELPFPCKTVAVFGGVSADAQKLELNRGRVLVATPGRLLDLIERNAVHLSAVKTLVLDEADKMLNLGFRKEMDEIFTFLPKKRQNLLFSATLSPNVEHIKQLLLKDPTVIQITAEENSIDLINQIAYSLTNEQKGPLLRALINQNKIKQLLVFTSSVRKADVVVLKLNKNNIKAKAIHSKKSQKERTDALTNFKSGKLRVLVATDLLSRGIDIKHLPYVINYELPRSPKDYIHRIGRTGRADYPGHAISFITSEDEHHFKVIQKKMKKQVDVLDIAETEKMIAK